MESWSLSPYINRFLSADTIVPSYANPQSLNRYSYVVNNPLRFTDPTGHMCHPEDDCGGAHYSTSGRINSWKWRIKHKYGVSISDDGGKDWSATNLSLVYSSLQNIDGALNGKLAGLLRGATLKLREYHNPGADYYGETSGSTITFYIKGSSAIRQQNFYHEFGHVFDNIPGKTDIFSNALRGLDNPTFITGAGVLDERNALNSIRVDDPNYGAAGVRALQHQSMDPVEQWADSFANYVAGNINLASSEGRAMNKFITGTLDPYISDPTRYEAR